MKLILTLLAGLMLTPFLSGQQQIDAWKCVRSTELVAYPEYQGTYASPIVYESNTYKSCKQAGETLADTKARVNALANADVLAWVESWSEVYYPTSEWWHTDEGFYWNCNGQMAMSPYPEPNGYAYGADLTWEEIDALEEVRYSESAPMVALDCWAYRLILTSEYPADSSQGCEGPRNSCTSDGWWWPGMPGNPDLGVWVADQIASHLAVCPATCGFTRTLSMVPDGRPAGGGYVDCVTPPTEICVTTTLVWECDGQVSIEVIGPHCCTPSNSGQLNDVGHYAFPTWQVHDYAVNAAKVDATGDGCTLLSEDRVVTYN